MHAHVIYLWSIGEGPLPDVGVLEGVSIDIGGGTEITFTPGLKHIHPGSKAIDSHGAVGFVRYG